MRHWTIWREGYCAQGNEAEAERLGRIEAEDFPTAVRKWYAEHPRAEDMEVAKFFDAERLTYWGCRHFDNEKDARALFG